MNIWLINPYGPIPNENWRDYSFTIFGKALSQKGYKVTWWTSNFSHHFKEYRSKELKEISVTKNFSIKLIPSPSYKKNISIRRVFRDWVFSYKTYNLGKKETRPDLIIYYESPLNFGYAGPALAKFHNSKLVYDQMDLWPELIINSFPSFLHPLFNFIFLPVFIKRKKIFNSLNGVIALAKPYLNEAFKVAPSLKSKPHEVIYNGISVKEFRKKNEDEALDPILDKKNKIKIIFAGSLGPSYDIESILKVAKRLEYENPEFHFMIAGDGPKKKMVLQQEKKLSNLFYLGNLKPSKLSEVLRKCDAGLLAYASNSNVEMPDKFYDYSAAGIAMICSLKGEVSKKIKKFNAGKQYSAGDATSLESVIKNVCLNKDELNNYKKNSYDCAYKFSSEEQNLKLLNFVEKIIRN